MKHLYFFALLTIAALLAPCTATARKIQIYTFTGRSASVPPPPVPLTIGGVTWATANVDEYQTFANRPDTLTKFYQWNRDVAYSATDPLTPAWNFTADNSETWTDNNPCPTGWRLPTAVELEALHNAGSTWATSGRGNAIVGRFYGPSHTTCTLPNNMNGCIFLPAVGNRLHSTSALHAQNTDGYYWSSTEYDSTEGYSLHFGGNSAPPDKYDKARGINVRCVQ